MLTKRPEPSAPAAAPKRKRKMLTIEEKSYAAVGHHFEINESSVQYRKKEEKNVRTTAAVSFNQNAKRVVTVHNKTIVRMESALAFASPTGTTPFIASKGWFDKFQKRFGLKSVSLHGEAASADTDGVEEYVNNKFKAIIEEGGYKPEQVFNMDETGLFWKRMPSCTFIMSDEAKAPGFKSQKDCVTVIMCGNAAGFMTKPGPIYKSKNPRALKYKNKNALPVYWLHNAQAWMTKVLTSDWFQRRFIPEVKRNVREKGLDFKVLLLMDNAGGHAADLSYDGVQIEYLPLNTTSLIQPMDQGIIGAFKALYAQNALQHQSNCNIFYRLSNHSGIHHVVKIILQTMNGEILLYCDKTLCSYRPSLFPRNIYSSKSSYSHNVRSQGALPLTQFKNITGELYYAGYLKSSHLQGDEATAADSLTNEPDEMSWEFSQ
uniref:DDE-1 domain-containing protein n=1 Tax=Poecilia latipinna TaxID=48699 RepID=A0A3B3TJJ8_9TELE